MKIKLTYLLFLSIISMNSPHLMASDQTDLTQSFMAAQKLAKEKKWKKAISLLEPLSEELPQEALLKLSSYYGKLKDFPSEIRHLNTLIDKNPKRALYYFRRGLSYSRIHSDKKSEQVKFNIQAIDNLQKAIKLQPKLKAPYESLLEVFNRTNNSFEARPLVLDMVQQFGEHPKYITELCRLHIKDEYIDDGIQFCKKAITKNPKEPMNYIFLAKGQTHKGSHEQAKTTLLQASQRLPHSAHIQEANGHYHLSKKNFATAIKYFQRAIVKDPSLVHSHVGLANSHFEQKDYKKALSSFINACRLDKSQTKSYRLAITKLRGSNNFKMSDIYENQMHKCSHLTDR